jgi:site-specific DNA-methyltransferase (cytosine-N4-specific)
MKKSDIPFGSEFSPNQIDLPVVLELAKKHGSDWKAFEAAVRQCYFETFQDQSYGKVL